MNACNNLPLEHFLMNEVGICFRTVGSKFYSNNSKAPPVTHAQNSVQKQKSKPQMLI